MLSNPQQSVMVLPGSVFPLDRQDFGFHQEVGIANYTSHRLYVMTMNGKVYTLNPLREGFDSYQRVEIKKSLQTHLTENDMCGYAGQKCNRTPYDQSLQTVQISELFAGPVVVREMGVALALEKDVGYLKEHNTLDPHVLLQMQFQYILASFKNGNNSPVQIMANSHDLTRNELFVSIDRRSIIAVKFEHNPTIDENIRFFFRTPSGGVIGFQSKHDPKNSTKLDWSKISAATGTQDSGAKWFYGTDRAAVQVLIDKDIAEEKSKLTTAEAEQIVNHKTQALQLENKNLKQKLELMSADVKNEDERLEESAKRQELRSREKLAKIGMEKSENEAMLQRAKLEEFITQFREERVRREEEDRRKRSEWEHEQQTKQLDMTMRHMQMEHERATNAFKMEKEKSSTFATIAKSIAAIGPILLSGILLLKNIGGSSSGAAIASKGLLASGAIGAIAGGTAASAGGGAAAAGLIGGATALTGGGIAGGLAIGAALGTAAYGLVSAAKYIGNSISRMAKRFWSWLTD